jgi:hypothetical protein
VTGRRVLVVVIGVIVAALVAAVVMIARIHRGQAGAAGPNALFQAALDAARRGDTSALLALHVSAGAARVTACARKAGDVPEDAPHGRYSSYPDEMRAYETKQLAAQLRYWKGRIVTIGAIRERGEPDVMPASASDSRERCKGSAPVTIHEYNTTLTVKDGDHTRTAHVTLAAAEIEGGWYFFDLPAPPTSAAVLTDLRDRMCRCATPACADKIQRAVDTWMRGVADPDLLAIENEITGCRTKASRSP